MTPIAMGAPLRSLLTRCGQRLPWLKTALARLEAFSIRARILCDGPSLSVRQRDLARTSAAVERCRAGADMRSATTRFRLSRSRRQSRYQEQSRWLTETDMKLQPSRRSQRRKHQSAACAVLRACAAGIPKDPARPQPCGSATPDQRSVLPQPPGRNSSARCRGWMPRTAAVAGDLP